MADLVIKNGNVVTPTQVFFAGISSGKGKDSCHWQKRISSSADKKG